MANPPSSPPANQSGCLVGGLIILGIVVAIGISNTHGPPAAVDTSATIAATAAVSAATPAYADPSRQAVENALKEEQSVYAAGGLSGLARRGQACFDVLNTKPDYGTLDFCLAFDVFATGQAASIMGATGIPPDSYFSKTASRAASAANLVIGSQSDPASRIADVRALATEVAAAAATSADTAATAADAAASLPADAPHTPSFDCTQVMSDNLKLICAAPVLADDDQDMADAFTKAAARTSRLDALRAEQRQWIQLRNDAVNDVPTLHELYRLRIAALQAWR